MNQTFPVSPLVRIAQNFLNASNVPFCYAFYWYHCIHSTNKKHHMSGLSENCGTMITCLLGSRSQVVSAGCVPLQACKLIFYMSFCNYFVLLLYFHFPNFYFSGISWFRDTSTVNICVCDRHTNQNLYEWWFGLNPTDMTIFLTHNYIPECCHEKNLLSPGLTPGSDEPSSTFVPFRCNESQNYQEVGQNYVIASDGGSGLHSWRTKQPPLLMRDSNATSKLGVCFSTSRLWRGIPLKVLSCRKGSITQSWMDCGPRWLSIHENSGNCFDTGAL